MKRLSIALLLALCAPLSACGPVSVNSAATVASKSLTAANELYTSASQAGEDMVRAGLLDKEQYKRADAKAYAVLIDFRLGHATFKQLADAAAAITGAE